MVRGAFDIQLELDELLGQLRALYQAAGADMFDLEIAPRAGP